MENRYTVYAFCGETGSPLLPQIRSELAAEGGIFLPETLVPADPAACSAPLSEARRAVLAAADALYVMNEDGRIGDKSREEIRLADDLKKTILYFKAEQDNICPCCGKFYYTEKNSYEICPVCGWEDDPCQRRHPDFAGGANRLSLLDSRKEYFRRMTAQEETAL